MAAAMEKSTSLNDTIERGPRESPSDEDGSSVNVSGECRTSQKPSNSATPTKEGTLFSMQVSDFQMVCVLGIGSRGKVLLAHHKSSSDLYALKVIAKRRVLASHDVQRTLTEQAVLRRMAIDGTNQFVAKLWRSFHDEDNLYLAMV
jgi:serum/glucocorticoid-regulated kinase 2